MLNGVRSQAERAAGRQRFGSSIPGLLVWLLAFALVCGVPLLRSLLDSWTFPWSGNPDQDLVFLRDGLRLWRGGIPGYGDHPGLVQMLIVRTAVQFAGWWPWWSVPLPLEQPWITPDDQQWQLLFVLAKSINALLMGLLLLACSLLWVPWLGRGRALLWGGLCSVSMGVVVEVYQLRNEFYSSFLALLALLVALAVARRAGRSSRQPPAAGVGGALASVAAAWLCLLLTVLAVLAKVQVVPILGIAAAAALALGTRLLGGRWLRACLSLLMLVLVSALGLITMAGGLSGLHGLQVVAVLVGLLMPSVVVLTQLAISPGLSRRLRCGSLVVAVPGLLLLLGGVFAPVARIGWLPLVLNPLAVRTHAAAAQRCGGGGLGCVVGQGLQGVLYLFERCFDGRVPVLIGAALVLVFWLLSLGVALGVPWLRPRRCSRPLALRGLWACLLLAVAFAMAFLAGQRWSVDHYLPYQQPFLFAGLLVLTRSGFGWPRVWRGVLAVVALSLVLLFLRYPAASRATYVKASLQDPRHWERQADGSLCAAQHAGAEWKRSSLWRLCAWGAGPRRSSPPLTSGPGDPSS